VLTSIASESQYYVRIYLKGQTEKNDKFSAAFKAWSDAKRSPKHVVSEILIYFVM